MTNYNILTQSQPSVALDLFEGNYERNDFFIKKKKQKRWRGGVGCGGGVTCALLTIGTVPVYEEIDL